MEMQENVNVRAKTTMRIGGSARYFAVLSSKSDVEEACRFASDKKMPLILLGSGSNTVFADGTIEALVVQLKQMPAVIDGNIVRVSCGSNLAMLINELAAKGLDLSTLTGIPGTIGGAVFGNAGQGPSGTWINSFVRDVTAYIDGAWKTFSNEECRFRYRESVFKDHRGALPPILWEATLTVPQRSAEDVQADVEMLLRRRIETQPHIKTAGSCFKAVGTTPAWQLIDAVGLRGHRIGDVQIAEKHANFLLNVGQANYEDAKKLVAYVKSKVPEPLEVEMRFIESNGAAAF